MNKRVLIAYATYAGSTQEVAVAIGKTLGDRSAPTASYASIAPEFHYDEKTAQYVGGQFWDGRAEAGERHFGPTATIRSPSINTWLSGRTVVRDRSAA